MTRRSARRLAVTVTAIWLAFAGSAAVAQQGYPSRPVRLITPAAPGGTTDLLARLVAGRLTDVFKQQVIVDNRASASGVVAGELTAQAPPDGYTLMIAYHQHTVNAALNAKLPYHPVNSFTPITQLTTAGLLLVVNPSSPPKTAKEFVDWTKNFKGPLNFGSAGNGSGGHLAGELYNLMTGLKAQHIPYKGTGPALIDLIAGQYHYNFSGVQPAIGVVRSGKLRGLAVTTSNRVTAFPDTPAMTEVLPGFEVVGWYGIIAPAKLPQPILGRLHAEITKIISDKAVQDRIRNDGSEPTPNSPEAFRKFMLADVAKWSKVVKDSGARLD